MTNKKPSFPDPNITQYGVLRARNLQEIGDVCDRHLRNITMTQLDMVDNGDMTPADQFYIDMFRKSWQEMKDDVTSIIAAQKPAPRISGTIDGKPHTPPPVLQTHVHVVEMVESERGMGQRPDGFMTFLTEKAAKVYVSDELKKLPDGPAPDVYVQYHYIGIKEASLSFVSDLIKRKIGRQYIDKIGELKK